MADEADCLDWMLRKFIIEELIHGSSFIYLVESGKAQEGSWYQMHQLVRQVAVSEIEDGSRLCDELYNVALATKHEALVTDRKFEDKTFDQMPDLFKINHCAIAATLYHLQYIIRSRQRALRYNMFRKSMAFIGTEARYWSP